MNKESIINKTKKKFKGELLKIVLKQIEDYLKDIMLGIMLY